MLTIHCLAKPNHSILTSALFAAHMFMCELHVRVNAKNGTCAELSKKQNSSITQFSAFYLYALLCMYVCMGEWVYFTVNMCVCALTRMKNGLFRG